MTRRQLISPSARWPLQWIFTVLWAAGVISATVTGAYAAAGSWPVWVSTVGGGVGVAGLLIVGTPRLRDGVILTGALLSSAITVTFGSSMYVPSLFTVGVMLCGLLMISGAVTLGLCAGVLLLAIRATAVVVRVPDASLVEVIDLYTVVVLTLAGLWVWYLRRLIVEENDFRRRGRAAVVQRREREQRLARTRMADVMAATGAVRALAHILSAPSIDASLRLEARVAEASLRDRMRCPGLDHPLLTPEIVAARRRGAQVLLLGLTPDEDGTVIALRGGLARALASAIREVGEGDRVTIRQFVDARGEVMTSLVSATSEGESMRLFDAAGVVSVDAL